MAVWTWVKNHRAELSKFASVGGVAFVVDLGVFNLLHTIPAAPLGHKPVTAKVLAAVVATVVAWVGNRQWTFRRHRTHSPARELIVFVAINAVVLFIPAGTVAFSTYVLGAAGPIADNIAAIVGIGIGTLVRYVGYKAWVFTGAGDRDGAADAE